jgi:hypothetical protein
VQGRRARCSAVGDLYLIVDLPAPSTFKALTINLIHNKHNATGERGYCELSYLEERLIRC